MSVGLTATSPWPPGYTSSGRKLPGGLRRDARGGRPSPPGRVRLRQCVLATAHARHV